ncbi:hypothetical protein VE00_04240 [Pseudogymnoascus sp. WSF 3629]|nr:hypothetical protein VE00_04240 [Pseudogymnoascus sp. WSF 3629]
MIAPLTASYFPSCKCPLKITRDNSLTETRYVVDGNALFLTATEAAWRRAASSHFAGGGIIVAIGYPLTGKLYDARRRSLDLTPPTKTPVPGYGGADAFIDFIDSKVRPAVKARFPQTTSWREAIYGHSYGGLFALHVLFTRPQMFECYIASSPSIWWNTRCILHEAKAFLQDNTSDERLPSLMLFYGSFEQNPPQWNDEPLDHYEGRKQVAADLRMCDNILDLYGKHSYAVLELWSGDLRNDDKALQLLLIIDYIFDWARDVYKPTVMTLLKSLRVIREDSNDKGATIAEVATDIDIFSHFGGQQNEPTADWIRDVIQARLPSPVEDFDLKSWRITHLHDCFFRPACFVTYHFQCLYITTDDVQKFLADFPPTVNIREILQRIDLVLKHNNCLVTENVLRRMEEIWTKRARPQQPQQVAEKELFATIVYHTEICSNFEIRRSLSCLALERSALITLRERIATESASMVTAKELKRLQEILPKVLNKARTLTELKMETLVCCILDLSIGDTLKAAISRHRKQLRPEAGSLSSNRSTNFEFIDIAKSPLVEIVITNVYEWPRAEPGEPAYLRFSQNTSTSTTSIVASGILPNTSSTASESENFVMVLFVKGGISIKEESYHLCLYEITGRTIPPSKAELAIALEATYKKGIYFCCGFQSKRSNTLRQDITGPCYGNSATNEAVPVRKSWKGWLEVMSQYLPQPKTIEDEVIIAGKLLGSAEKELATSGPKLTEETSILPPSTVSPRSLEVKSASTASSTTASTLAMAPLLGEDMSSSNSKRKLRDVDAGKELQASKKQRKWVYNDAGVIVLD